MGVWKEKKQGQKLVTTTLEGPSLKKFFNILKMKIVIFRGTKNIFNRFLIDE